MPVLAQNARDFVTAKLGDIGGDAISRERACRLLRAGDGDLPTLLLAAQAARARFKPGFITYSRKVFIPLTNLCRDYCGYCTFRRDPSEPGAHTMTPDEVMEVVRAGERMGCTEALFSLGDKPELVFPEMRETLRHLGYKSTLHYLEAMCEKVLRESTLLPHPNPGLMSAEWLERLARVAPSVGLMLETTSARLMAKGAAHDNAPDKDPAKRLRVMEDAGRRRIPFTTGILIGIGETLDERVDALIAIRELHEKYGHVQEVIVQNFRAKAGTAMAAWPEPTREDMLRTLAVARLLMPTMNIQAPPNLSDPHYADLLDAGINDWGGVSPLTPDFINPEKPWPHLDELRRRTEAKGLELRQRLPVYAEFAGMAGEKSELVRERMEAWRPSAAKAATDGAANGAAPPQIAQSPQHAKTARVGDPDSGRSGDPVQAAPRPKAICATNGGYSNGSQVSAERQGASLGHPVLGTAGEPPAPRSSAGPQRGDSSSTGDAA